MNYTTGRAFRQALESRLLANSLQTATPLVRLRKLVAFERLLARLAGTQPEAWVLKGGLVLQLRFGERARLTKDIDLLLRQPLAEAHLLLRRGAAADLGDWFAFEVSEAAPAPESTQATVRRFPVHSLLDSRTFEDFHVDVGTGDPVVEPVDVLTLPSMLAFAGVEPAAFPAYPLTQHVAEKVHAYSQTRPSGEATRVRDLVDLLLIAGNATFDSTTLRSAIAATFSTRKAHAVPERLSEPPTQWRIPYRRLAGEVRLAWTDLTEGYRAAAAFLDPVLQARVRGAWDPATWTWS